MLTGRTSRREFVGALGATMALGAEVNAQNRTKRIGVLMNFAADNAVAQARLSKFLAALETLGWSPGRNINIEIRWSDGNTDRLRKGAAELIALSPDLIVGATTPAVISLKRATDSIPVVFVNVVDPVGAGIVTSMSRPGGNATGFVTFEYALAAKWLDFSGKSYLRCVGRRCSAIPVSLQGLGCLRPSRPSVRLVSN